MALGGPRSPLSVEGFAGVYQRSYCCHYSIGVGWLRIKVFRNSTNLRIAIQYQSYTCAQLAEEAQRVSSAAATATGVQDKQATNDAVALGVGFVIFWPSLFFIGGDKVNAAQLAHLKGEMDAIQEASIQKKCGFQFQTVPPPKAG